MNIIEFSEIDSTNKYLKENHQILDDFTFVKADYQSAGKGREDRVWSSKSGENLLFSILIKREHLINKYSELSILSAALIRNILENLGILNVSVKWPNDVYVNDKKICGVLLEGELPNYIVIGVGLNVNQKEFLGEYRKEPTSIYLETAKITEINDLFNIIVKEFDAFLNHFEETKPKLVKDLLNHNYLKGKDVEFIFNEKVTQGKVVGINDNFSLVVDINKTETSISSGEIKVL